MNLITNLARYGASNKARFPFQLAFGRAFDQSAEVKALVLFEPSRISFSQVYPFLHYRRAFAERYGVQFRFVPSKTAEEAIAPGHREATHVVVQTWLTDPPDRLPAICDQLHALPRAPRLVYFDSFANTDIRLARQLDEYDLYYKKSLFAEPEKFLTPTHGHTNLAEYYSRLHGITQDTTDWMVPPSILPRLRLSPNFLTDPRLLRLFLGKMPDMRAISRQLDLHARLGGMKAKGWYGAMRRDAAKRTATIQGLAVRSGTGVSSAAFLRELRQSKLCFSPFGYGEVCWRDIEAIAMGAVLVKPDMSHLRTKPDLYCDGETYVAVRWDFSDLEDRIRDVLSNDARRESIARTAWIKARSWLESGGPIHAFHDIFSETPQAS